MLFVYFVFIILYLILSLVYMIALHKSNTFTTKNQPSVSIIIAARDEENVITECLDSLYNLDYAENLLEIVLINDRSSDNTGKIMENFSRESKNVKVISIKENNSNFSGKSNALNLGVDESSGDILFFTDADCKVPRTWIKEMVNKMPDDNTILSGFLFLDDNSTKHLSSLFSQIQSLDWILFCSIGMASANIGHPLSIFGNNFAVSKKLFLEMEGFRGAGYHPTEDYAFMRKAVKEKNAKVVFSLSQCSSVFTHPTATIKDFISQRKRWALGSQKRDILSQSLILFSIITLWTSLIFLFSREALYGFIGFALITLSDSIILFRPLSKLKRLYLLKNIFFYKLFFAAYTVYILFLSFVNKETIWKGDKIKKGKSKRI